MAGAVFTLLENGAISGGKWPVKTASEFKAESRFGIEIVADWST